MKDKKKLDVLLKVIQRIYDKNTEMQEVIDAMMLEVCTEEGVSPEKIFFYFAFFCCCLFDNSYSRKNLNKSVEDIKNNLWKL